MKIIPSLRITLPALLLGSFGVAASYFGLHLLFSQWVAPPRQPPPSLLGVAVLLCFGLLFALQSVIAARPNGRLARSLYPWFYAGLFLDERFSRIVFALWPLRLPAPVPNDPLGECPAASNGARS